MMFLMKKKVCGGPKRHPENLIMYAVGLQAAHFGRGRASQHSSRGEFVSHLTGPTAAEEQVKRG